MDSAATNWSAFHHLSLPRLPLQQEAKQRRYCWKPPKTTQERNE